MSQLRGFVWHEPERFFIGNESLDFVFRSLRRLKPCHFVGGHAARNKINDFVIGANHASILAAAPPKCKAARHSTTPPLMRTDPGEVCHHRIARHAVAAFRRIFLRCFVACCGTPLSSGERQNHAPADSARHIKGPKRAEVAEMGLAGWRRNKFAQVGDRFPNQ